MSGLKLAAVFGFYPNKLGFCGSQELQNKKVLFDFISHRKVSEQKIRKILKSFEAAFPYYELIAKSNRVKDPFDKKVVMAYWIGNKLLENVLIGDLKKLVNNKFNKKIKIPENSLPHHSFHVLCVGSATGKIKLKGKLLGLCCISSGIVVKKQKSGKVSVKYQNRKQKQIFWDKKIAPNIKVGDRVAIHWNHIVKIINKCEAAALKKYTYRS